MLRDMKRLLNDFRAFAFGGSLVDLAIGIAIGAAFAGVVDSLVSNLILPFVADVVGSPDFSTLHGSFRGKAEIPYGAFLTDLIAFLILAFVILLLVKLIKSLTKVEVAGAQGNRECPHCKSFIPVDAGVCMFCTRDVEAVVAG